MARRMGESLPANASLNAALRPAQGDPQHMGQHIIICWYVWPYLRGDTPYIKMGEAKDCVFSRPEISQDF